MSFIGSNANLPLLFQTGSRCQTPNQIRLVKRKEDLPTWLADWTVKADLNLQANEQGGISPNGSYTVIRRSAVNTAAGPTTSPGTTLGTVAQLFTLSATANAGEQAVRNETLSFTLSLKELKDWYVDARTGCQAAAEQGLLGNLGIAEWIDASLAPVGGDGLLAGKHPAPNMGAKASAPSITAPPKVIIGNLTADFLSKNRPAPLSPTEAALERAKLDQAIKDANAALTAAQASYASINASVTSLKAKTDKLAQMQITYNGILAPEIATQFASVSANMALYRKQAELALQCTIQQVCGAPQGDCSGFPFHATDKFEVKPTQKKDPMCPAVPPAACNDNVHPDTISGILNEIACVTRYRNESILAGDTEVLTKNYYNPAMDALKIAQTYADNARKLATFAQNLAGTGLPKTPDPPVDSIGHLIQFVVGYGAGISPNWTLIAWKGPGVNGSLISGSVNRTHILQLALGSPQGGASSQEQTRILNNQLLLNLGQ